jgi:hypothetical protein
VSAPFQNRLFSDVFIPRVSHKFSLFPLAVLTTCLLEALRGRRKARRGRRAGRSGPANITKRAVDAAKARTKDTYLWDRGLHGFGLKVTPAGSKVYLVQYRLGGRKGRTRLVTIGQHRELTPPAARAEAKRLLGEIAAGRDPAAARDKARYKPLRTLT